MMFLKQGHYDFPYVHEWHSMEDLQEVHQYEKKAHSVHTPSSQAIASSLLHNVITDIALKLVDNTRPVLSGNAILDAEKMTQCYC